MKNTKSEQKEMGVDFVEVENPITEPNPTPTVTKVKKKVGIQYRNTPNKQVFVSGDANAEFEVIDDSNGEVVGKGKTTDKGESIVICSYISKTLKAIALSLICVINIFAQQTTQVNVQQQTVTATGPLVKTGNVLSINPASTTSAGSMSIADKIKLDGIVPVFLSNNAAPFSFNTTTQVGNIPQVPSIINGQLVQGDGTTPEQIPDNWRVGRGATGALPDGSNDVTEKIGHQSDIYVGADALVTVGHGGGNIASNTAVGNFALESNTTGANNTSVGDYSLYKNISGNNNVAIGAFSLYNNILGSYNVGIGEGSLFSNTNGIENTGNGNGSLRNNTTGSFNVAIGLNSLYHNNTGSYNTSIGVNSLHNNKGSNNTANGNLSLFSNTNGNFNTALGHASLNSNTIGNENVGIGVNSLFFNQESQNTSIGYDSFTGNNVLVSGATITASSATRITLSTAMTPSPSVGTFITIVPVAGFFSSISGFTIPKSFKVINATTLEVTDPSQVLGLTGTVTGFEIRQSKGYTNSSALGYNAEPTASNQVMLGDVNVTQVVSTGTFFGAGFTVASDKRIKSEIKDLTPEMITALKSIKPKIYKNANTGKTEMGVIAQDIPEILRPYLVTIIPQVYSKVKSAELKLTLAKKLGYKSISDYTKAVEANKLALLSKPTDAKLLAEKERLTITNDTAYLTDFYSVDYAKLAAMVALVK